MTGVNCGTKFVVGLLTVFLAFVKTSATGTLLPLALLSPQLFTTFAWRASPSPEVVGYAVYYQALGVALTNRLDVGDHLTASIPLLVGSTYSIHVVAYTAEGVESEPSNVLEYTPPPLTRLRLVTLDGGGVQIRFRTSPLALCRVERTDSLTTPDWQVWVTVRADFNGDVVLNDATAGDAPARFYRAAKL